MIRQIYQRAFETDPLAEFRRLRQEMNRLMAPFTPWAAEFPPVNIWASNEELVLTTELPGMEAGELDISVRGDVLTIRGERKPDKLGKDETYHRQERESGPFVRTLRLPFMIEADKVEARMEKGVLHLRLPRAEKEKPRKIQIKAEK